MYAFWRTLNCLILQIKSILFIIIYLYLLLHSLEYRRRVGELTHLYLYFYPYFDKKYSTKFAPLIPPEEEFWRNTVLAQNTNRWAVKIQTSITSLYQKFSCTEHHLSGTVFPESFNIDMWPTGTLINNTATPPPAPQNLLLPAVTTTNCQYVSPESEDSLSHHHVTFLRQLERVILSKLVPTRGL